jgi:cysteine desulfurase
MNMFTLFGKKRVYLDWASAAQVLPKPHRAFVAAFPSYENPSSVHDEGQNARRVLEDARTRIARLAGIKVDAVIFTSGATEANNLAIQGVLKAHTNPHVLYLPSAHSSVTETVQAMVKDGVEIETIALAGTQIDLETLKKQLRPETVLVCVDAVCGETGVRFATRDVRRVLDAARPQGSARILLHVDASQTPFIENIDRLHLGADLLTLDAQKVGGVRGIGVLIAPSVIPLQPILFGGGQERGLRPGTESPALAQAFAVALEQANEGREKFIERARAARAAFLTSVVTAIPDVLVNEAAKQEQQAPHIINLSFPGRDTDYAVMLMNTAGFTIATRSACETDSETGSRAVQAYFDNAQRSSTTLRISWGPSTSERDIRRGAEALVQTIRFLDAHTV